MDTLNDLLAASDLVSLHCGLTNETMHILNADCLQHIKPGMLFFCNCVMLLLVV
jgi:phosphoglycerate dehydrogenase-like enzyme